MCIDFIPMTARDINSSKGVVAVSQSVNGLNTHLLSVEHLLLAYP